MGGTGNLRTLRLSGSNGSRTLGSLIADGVSAGGGSMRRVYGYYAAKGITVNTFYYNVFGITYGQDKNRARFA
jgi:hypothetical protein